MIQDFISRDLEFWAIDPTSKHIDIVATKDSVLRNSRDLSGNLLPELLLVNCDSSEDQDEKNSYSHTLAYLAAGLYHEGLYVQKNELLADQSIENLIKINRSHSQASALMTAAGCNVGIFSYLIARGLYPRQKDELGTSMIDVALFDIEGKEHKSILDILRKNAYIASEA